MSGIYVSPTAALISTTGIAAPSYQTILAYLQAQYQAIYGTDVYLGNDSQDGQLLGIFALAISDANSMAIAAYNSFSPATAQGVGLSSNVKINGLQRLVPTNGTVDLLIVGQFGITIVNGYAIDNNNNWWLMPSSVEIPISGEITVTATAQNPGNILAPEGTIIKIGNPQYGWQSVTNTSDAVPGQPVEIDATLRQRQSVSTMIPSITVMDGIIGAIDALEDVTRVVGYQNASGTTNANGIPPNALSMVVEGGNSLSIATILATKMTLGAPTYGTTSVTVIGTYGDEILITFFRPTEVTITVVVTLTAYAGYTVTDGTAIINAVIAYITTTAIGGDADDCLPLTSLYGPAYSPATGTYKISGIQISRSGAVGNADIPLAFNEAATATTASVTVVANALI